MSHVYLFDWGDTLMVDFAEQKGKMYLWPQVEAVEEAEETLKALSKNHTIYVATSAQESTESEIQQAFERVGLDPYINGYFCKANLGLEKNSPEFYQAILESLGDSASQVTMVGDNLDKDIYPALEAGLQAIYYNPQRTQVPEGINSVSRLSKLLAAN
ncbi:HAD-IA family hydrolase [Vibrio tubiashii]|uniref:HAD-IA family hydrolase n=1 Tax=Vibrio tubiashii TaxID=29498 RepID=A0AAE5LH84_9VIBR|nr:HAD-IA family hydrolase [Vibrio tubiashii]NOI80201.1 HAD-IA family hydrolase [Vibrio tubiashii]